MKGERRKRREGGRVRKNYERRKEEKKRKGEGGRMRKNYYRRKNKLHMKERKK